MGALLGHSVLNLLSENVQGQLSFITDIALGFVALLSIGLELNIDSLKKQGWTIISIILSESFMAFILGTIGIFFLTGDLPMALIFGAVAPASAPAGRVAVIQNSRHGAALRRLFLVCSSGKSKAIGMFLLFIATGIAQIFHFSLILTNMMIGIVAVNTQHNLVYISISDELKEVMPLIFVLFFGLAGSYLHLSALPALGLIGVVYFICRTAGLMSGAWLGAVAGKVEDKILKYLELGILSQAGIAI